MTVSGNYLGVSVTAIDTGVNVFSVSVATRLDGGLLIGVTEGVYNGTAHLARNVSKSLIGAKFIVIADLTLFMSGGGKRYGNVLVTTVAMAGLIARINAIGEDRLALLREIMTERIEYLYLRIRAYLTVILNISVLRARGGKLGLLIVVI
jgi:hypothetical protein